MTRRFPPWPCSALNSSPMVAQKMTNLLACLPRQHRDRRTVRTCRDGRAGRAADGEPASARDLRRRRCCRAAYGLAPQPTRRGARRRDSALARRTPDDLAELAADLLLRGVDQCLETRDRRPHLLQRVRAMVGRAKLGMRRGQRLLVVEVQLFVQLFAGSDARKGDLDQSSGSPERRTRSRARSTIFTDSPISSTKISPPLPIAAACKHQLRGFGNGHEKTRHVGIGDGDRAAAANLVLKDRHHAAVGAQHVAEADDGEAGRGDLRHGVDEPLGDLLRHAHHARRIDRLVGRNEDEFLTPNSSANSAMSLVPPTLLLIASPTFNSISGTCLCAAAWNTTSGWYRGNLPHAAARSVMSAMHGCSAAAWCAGVQLSLDQEDAVLAAADQQQRSRVETEQLAANLRADAAAGAGDHHGAALDQAADDVHVQLHRCAAEQVADFDVANGNAVVAAQAVLNGANDFQFQSRFLAGNHQIPQARALPACPR